MSNLGQQIVERAHDEAEPTTRRGTGETLSHADAKRKRDVADQEARLNSMALFTLLAVFGVALIGLFVWYFSKPALTAQTPIINRMPPTVTSAALSPPPAPPAAPSPAPTTASPAAQSLGIANSAPPVVVAPYAASNPAATTPTPAAPPTSTPLVSTPSAPTAVTPTTTPQQVPGNNAGTTSGDTASSSSPSTNSPPATSPATPDSGAPTPSQSNP